MREFLDDVMGVLCYSTPIVNWVVRSVGGGLYTMDVIVRGVPEAIQVVVSEEDIPDEGDILGSFEKGHKAIMTIKKQIEEKTE